MTNQPMVTQFTDSSTCALGQFVD